MKVCRMHLGLDDQTLSVHQQVTFPSLYFLTPVVASRPPFRWSSPTGCRLSQHWESALDQPSPAPAPLRPCSSFQSRLLYTKPRSSSTRPAKAESLRGGSARGCHPRARRRCRSPLPECSRCGMAARLGLWHQRLQDDPLPVGQVTGVSLLLLPHATALTSLSLSTIIPDPSLPSYRLFKHPLS